MMLKLVLKALRVHAFAGAVLAASLVSLMPFTPVGAQANAAGRGLPDFTELVEQVGPSVVNIRTTEKLRGNGNPGGSSDEEMQEFFRRLFGLPMSNGPHQALRPNRP